MQIYNYHPEYNHFTGISSADESPLEPSVFLIPSHATSIPLPSFVDGYIPVFNNNEWKVIEDKRGEYYDISTKEKIENYNPLEAPENTTKEQPPEVLEGFYLEWNNSWELKEIPVPEPLTPEQKLSNAGLTVEELKALLGL